MPGEDLAVYLEAEEQRRGPKSFAAVVRRYGTRRSPEGAKLDPTGVPSECFRNAFWMAEESCGELVYCEGFAASQLIPVVHAWVVDTDDGHVIETTWPYVGFDYYGLEFHLGWVRQTLIRTKWYGMLPPLTRQLAKQPDLDMSTVLLHTDTMTTNPHA